MDKDEAIEKCIEVFVKTWERAGIVQDAIDECRALKDDPSLLDRVARLEERVARLDETLRTLISWLRRELGDDAVRSLLKSLEGPSRG